MGKRFFRDSPPDRYPPTYYASVSENEALPAKVLTGDLHTDVCVIGGGYTGLSTALHLARAGIQVAVAERAKIGWGASGRNGGQIHVGMRREPQWLERRLGIDAAKALWAIAINARNHLDWAIDHYKINCDIRSGFLHLDHKPGYVSHSRDTAQILRDSYGHTDVEFVDRERARSLVASPGYYGGLLDRRGGHLDPLKWALGIAKAAVKEGAHLYEQTAVTSVKRKNGKFLVTTDQGTITADRVVLACNGYLDGLDHKVESHVMPINNFVAVSEPLGESGAESLIRENLAVSDSRFIVYYYRMTPDHRLLFGGGENYSYRFPENISEFVRPHITKVFPQLKDVAIDYGWGGTLAITPNRLPYVRWTQPGMLSISGYSGLGVVLAPYFGKLAADALTGGSAELDQLMALPVPRFPGGRWLRWPTMVAAMSFFGILDRL